MNCARPQANGFFSRILAAFRRFVWLALVLGVAATAQAGVYLSSYTFSSANVPYVYTNESLPIPFKLRVKIIGVSGYPNGFHAVQAYNNNYYSLESLPTPGTYTVALYWLKYASDWTTLLEVGPQTTTTITVQSPPAVNGVAWNSINLPTDGTGIGLPGQTITATATVTNNGSTYWDDAYYLELKDANENHLNYPQINGVSPGSSKTSTFVLTLPSTAGIYTYGFTAMQNGVQYFGGTQYRTITVNRNPVAGSFTASASTISAGQTVTLSGLVTDPDSNLTSQVIDYLAPGSATWISGTVASGTRWDGAATSANTLSKTMVLSTAGTWQFRVRGGDALGGTSAFLYQNITVQSSSAVNGVAWNSINLPTDGTSIGLPGQTITATATVTNNGSTYWDDAYYLELKDANENHLNYPQINGVSPGSPKTATFGLTLPSTAGVYTYGFTAVQQNVQYFGGTQYRTITVNRNPVAGTLTASASTIFAGQAVTLSGLVTDPDSNLTSQAIDYLAPGSATWIGGTVAAGTRWDGAATSANTLTKTMVLSTVGTWQFRLSGGDALGGTSTFLYQNVIIAPAPPPIRLALQYWQQNDYPDREYGHDENYWVDGYWDSQWTYDWSNPEWWNTGHYEDVWVDGHDETNFVVDGTYADGEFGSRWDTTTGTYGQPATSATGAFNPAATNRGYVLNSYELSTRTTFRAWASAPAANCNTYQAVLYSPTGSILASGSFASNSYWQFDFYPYPAGAYRVDLSFQNASATTPASGTVSYYIPVGISLPPTITTQPSPTSQSVASGATVTYSVGASLATTYQWRKDGASISGATSSTLTLTNVQPSNSGSYTVVVSNTGGSQTSAAANLTVSVTAPAISSQPVSQTTNVGQPVSFAVAATGTAPLAYQWLKNGVALPGATNASLTLANPQTTDAANAPGYTVMVSNLAGTATSSAAALTVNLVAPSITTQPISRSVYTGATVTFSVVAGGTAPLTYLWRKNGVNVGINSSNYTISSALTSDAGAYSVVVSNGAGAVTSNSANLTVTVVDPIRLAVKYWRANDYPNRTWYTYEEVWVGDWRTVDEYDENGDWSGSHDEWIDWEWQWVYHYAPTGEFAPRWDTTAGDFDLASTASGYSAATANRGYFKNAYNPGDLITFHPYATAPSANCSNYTWSLFSPSGSPIAGYWFSGITAWSFSANYGAGNYRVDVSYQSATSGTPLNATVSYYIPVGVAPPAVPAVTSPLAASGTVSTSFAYTVTATNSPTIYGATGLPAGLTLNTATGAITGTPTAAGTFSVSLSASNAGGTSLAATMVLSVGSGVPVITSPLAASGTVGTAFAYTITATNSPTNFGATGLPAGLTLNTATGAITGTPTAAGAYSVSLTASNSGGTSQTASAVLTMGSGVAAPSALRETERGSNHVALAWNAPTGGAAVGHYEISIGTDPIVFCEANQTSFLWSGLNPSTSYTFQVRAVDAANNRSTWAVVANVTTLALSSPSGASQWIDLSRTERRGNTTYYDTLPPDGVRDEVIGVDQIRFSARAIQSNWSYPFNSYWTLWGITWPDGSFTPNFTFALMMQPFWDYDAPAVTSVDVELSFTSEPDQVYAVLLDDSPGHEFRPENAEQHSLPTSYPNAALQHIVAGVGLEKLQFAKFYLVRYAFPIGSVSASGSPLRVSVGSARGLGGTLSLPFPAAGSVVVSIKDTVNAALKAGSKVVWEVWDGINQIRVGTSTVGDLLDLGVNTSGEFQVGLKLDDSTKVWFNVSVQPPPAPKLAVDANRDGTITFDAADGTSVSSPYRFWLNDDIDRLHTFQDSAADSMATVSETEEDDIGPAEASQFSWQADYLDGRIESKRDLEDFSRLWINTQGLNAAFKNGDLKLGLKWTDTASTTPAIQLYESVEVDGGLGYLTDDAIAANQLLLKRNAINLINTATGYAATQISGTGTFVLPTSLFANLSDTQPKTYLLFEGCAVGKGQLKLVILKLGSSSSYSEIGEGSGVWMDLKKIGDMYEHWSVGNASGGAPNTIAARVPSLTGSGTAFSYDNPTPSPEERKYILFVHGWNMEQWDKERFAETAFKRLWWQGYKGRFGLFSWPCTNLFDETSTLGKIIEGISDGTHFDRGEWSAWRSGTPLRQLLQSLNGGYGGQLYTFSHSMGGIVMSEALRLQSDMGGGQIANVYVASQAALSAHLYDGTLSTAVGSASSVQWEYIHPKLPIGSRNYGPQTTNVYRNWLAYLLNGSATSSKAVGTLVNFYNQNDWALAAPIWQFNQITKPDWPDVFHSQPYKYVYTGDPAFFEDTFSKRSGEVVFPLALGTRAGPQDRYEIMAFAAESHVKSVGATPNVSQGVTFSFDVRSIWPADGGDHKAHIWHSAQFRSTMAKQKDYWKELLGQPGFQIPTIVLP